MRAFLVELVEFVLQRLFVGRGVMVLEGKGDDVVHMEGIGYGDEVPTLGPDDEQFVHAWLINVLSEAKRLQDIERARRVAHPVCIPSDRLLTGDLLDLLDAVVDEAPLGVRVEETAVCQVLPWAAAS